MNTKDFVGVAWHKSKYPGKPHTLGCFDDEQEAAMAYDTAARRLRPQAQGEAHSGRSGARLLQLNFPTAQEEAFAKDAEMQPPKRKRK